MRIPRDIEHRLRVEDVVVVEAKTAHSLHRLASAIRAEHPSSTVEIADLDRGVRSYSKHVSDLDDVLITNTSLVASLTVTDFSQLIERGREARQRLPGDRFEVDTP